MAVYWQRAKHWQWAKSMLRFGAIITLSYLVFGLSFNERQSSLLGILAATVLEGFLQISHKARPFQPFGISIKFMSSALLDHGLVDESGLTTLQANWAVEDNPVGREKYHVLKDGINFTVLSPKLFYRDDFHTFHTELDFGGTVPELACEDRLGGNAPALYVKDVCGEGVAAWEVGLITEASLAKMSYEDDPDGRIILATLPQAVFAEQYGNTISRAKLETLLTKHGWSRYEYDHNRLNHKYAWCVFREI